MVGVTVYLRDSHVGTELGNAGSMWVGPTFRNEHWHQTAVATYNVLFTLRARWRPEDGEIRRTKAIYHCSR